MVSFFLLFKYFSPFERGAEGYFATIGERPKQE